MRTSRQIAHSVVSIARAGTIFSGSSLPYGRRLRVSAFKAAYANFAVLQYSNSVTATYANFAVLQYFNPATVNHSNMYIPRPSGKKGEREEGRRGRNKRQRQHLTHVFNLIMRYTTE
jgi:hypothetical protein